MKWPGGSVFDVFGSKVGTLHLGFIKPRCLHGALCLFAYFTWGANGLSESLIALPTSVLKARYV
jgi:hypothetical protein